MSWSARSRRSLWIWVDRAGLDAKDRAAAQLDALKTGLSTGLGGGGIFALYLGWRRQRSTEEDLDQRERALEHQQQVAADTTAYQERVAAATEADARERRITELYTKAAEQLGSDKAPVRLAGLYALERLAQNTPDQRQTIVNVPCAYLRMPYEVPPTHQPRKPTSRPRTAIANRSRNAKSGSPPNASFTTTSTPATTVSIRWTPSGQTSTSI